MLACYALGTRRMEICGLRPQDVDWLAGKVYLRRTKGAKPRDVPIGELAGEALRELDRLHRGGPTLLGIQPSTFTGWVNQAARDCGFPTGRKRRAHTLRATFATDLDHAGVSGRTIQELLGHESLSTTTVYIGVNDIDLAAAVEVLR
jgi:integrase/recombinase XerD